MAKIGGFTKTRQYVRRQRALGCFRSPYQKGGTIIGQSMNPFFPIRARPWEIPPMARIKAVRKRTRRTKR